jgi:hypothetical protein
MSSICRPERSVGSPRYQRPFTYTSIFRSRLEIVFPDGSPVPGRRNRARPFSCCSFAVSACPRRISPIPARMVGQEKPVARATALMPPRPRASTSAGDPRRRLCSLSTGRIPLYFSALNLSASAPMFCGSQFGNFISGRRLRFRFRLHCQDLVVPEPACGSPRSTSGCERNPRTRGGPWRMMRLGVQRLWGSIHIEPSDFVGRRLGRQVGLEAVERTHAARLRGSVTRVIPVTLGRAERLVSDELSLQHHGVACALEGGRCSARVPAWEAGAGLSGEGHHPISTGG